MRFLTRTYYALILFYFLWFWLGNDDDVDDMETPLIIHNSTDNLYIFVNINCVTPAKKEKERKIAEKEKFLCHYSYFHIDT